MNVREKKTQIEKKKKKKTNINSSNATYSDLQNELKNINNDNI